MTTSFKVIIPARYSSTRLPGKALLKIGNKPLIQHVYESAKASSANEVIIATDDDRIRNAAGAFGATVVMTSEHHQSGTERINEVISILNEDKDTIIVNLQGDEYGYPSALIDQVATNLENHSEVAMATLCKKITDEKDFNDPNLVKVVLDKNNYALYFSRASIPARHMSNQTAIPEAYGHMGIYAYHASFLKEYATLPACILEQTERLEQLRALYYGFEIHVGLATESGGIGVDTQADLEAAQAMEEKKNNRK